LSFELGVPLELELQLEQAVRCELCSFAIIYICFLTNSSECACGC